MMTTPDQTAQLASAFVAHLPSQFSVAQAILFGSRARGTAHEGSDTDVAIILRGEPGHFIDTKLALADEAYDFLMETGVHIQPLPIWEVEWQHPDEYANPRLLHNIAREGIALAP
jgi:predicted nucleotidyltransferase